MPTKECFVPGCKNNFRTTPNKLFLSMPSNEDRRKRWFAAVRKPYIKFKKTYCCEDHFDLSKDATNWLYYQQFGGKISLKPEVVPHKLVGPQNPDPLAITPLDVLDYNQTLRREELAKREAERNETDVQMYVLIPSSANVLQGKEDVVQIMVAEEDVRCVVEENGDV